MGLTAFPYGVSSFGIPVLGSGAGNIPVTLGNYIFVNGSTGVDDPSYGTMSKPYDTIDYAIGKVSANDVIIVGPGHTETVSAASGITCDVAGITIVGLGSGSKRPTITLGTATAASIVVSAADVTIDNILFTSALDNVATCFTITGKNFTIKNCEFRDASDALHFLSCILTGTTDNGADGLSVINCKRWGLAAANTAFISILGNCDRMLIKDNWVQDASTVDAGHFIIMSTKVCLDTLIIGNICNVLGATNAAVGIFITGDSTTSTGVLAYNLCSSLDTTTELFATAGLDFFAFENYYCGTIATSGKLWPTADGA
jgi:hypothetical protein